MYGNGIFVTKLNAKELILKKINADTNWVDIYTSAFMLGENLSDVGDFMISPEITELINKFTTNIFDPTNVGTKTMFIEQAIKNAGSDREKDLYTELLERVNISEELRILGKILKINQGMPTKTIDLYKYVNSIESFIEERLNIDLINQYKQALNDLQEAIGDDENPNWDDPKLKAALTIYKSAKNAMQTSYTRFNFINFLQNPNYQAQVINQYESVKVKFNILDALVSSPHFSEMQKVLALNTTILNALSKRNEIESKVWRFAQHKNAIGRPALFGSLNDTERKALKTLTEQTLINEWISVGLDGRYVEYGEQHFDFNSGFDTNKFKTFVESIIIPLLKYNMLKTPNGDTIPTRDNEFVKKLTFGKHNGVSIYKLPFNMTEIDSDESTRLEYEKILNAFGDLRNITLHGGLNITDIFYLYNLIVHNDHFGRNSLTRLFEDLISSKDGEKLLVFKFNEWLETVNEGEIVDKVLSSWGASHHNNIQYQNTLSNYLITTSKSVESTPKTRTVKYTPKGQAEQTYTIVGNKIYNTKGEEVYATDSKHRRRIFANLALSEGRAVIISYNGIDYIINNRNQILSTRTNDIMQWPDNHGDRIAILEKAKEEFAKLQNIGKTIDINTISTKTEAFGVVFPKQGKTSQALKSEYQQWQTDNPTGIVAYRVKFPYNTIEEVQLGHIGNPFSENARGANTVQQFYDWLVTGNNFGNEKATDEYRRAIISKLLSIPANSPILYYTELNRPSHATVLGYLIANKQLLSNQSSPNPVQFDDSIDISEESVAEEPITIGFDNTSERVSEENDESNYTEPIRRLQLLDDYYRPIFTSEELIAFEEDAKRIFENDLVINERVNIHYSEWKTLDDITEMRRWEKIWEDIVYDGSAEESENDFKYNNKSKTVQIPKYIYDRIKLYQKYQKLVDFLMGIAQKNNYHDYYGNLLRHDEDWFGSERIDSLNILTDLYDFAGIKEIYDDPNQLRLFDSLHIDSDYIVEREEILRNAPRNAEGKLLAPNGKVSKLTEEQWVTVRTKAFKEWFGDWETDPSNASKVLDENGEPLKMYHGSHSQFETFDYGFITDVEGGFFFTSDENYAKQYGTIIYPVFLNVKHPIDTDIPLHRSNLISIYNKSSIERFDGIIGNDLLDDQLVPSEGWEVMIYNKNQVKSINNRGTFSNLDNTIYDSDSIPVYQTTPSKQSKLIELVRQANEFGIKGLHIVSNSDIINEPIEVRSALGFVRNGEIYINIDKAGDDTVIHEFGHLYLADAKINNRDAYYVLLDKVRNTELWRKMKTWRAYANKIGSDFDEEVLATMIGNYYKHRNSTFGQDYEYESLVQEALSLVNQSFMDLINSEILPDLGDTFITNYALQQKIATIKGRLVSDNILKENCQ